MQLMQLMQLVPAVCPSSFLLSTPLVLLFSPHPFSFWLHFFLFDAARLRLSSSLLRLSPLQLSPSAALFCASSALLFWRELSSFSSSDLLVIHLHSHTQGRGYLTYSALTHPSCLSYSSSDQFILFEKIS